MLLERLVVRSIVLTYKRLTFCISGSEIARLNEKLDEFADLTETMQLSLDFKDVGASGSPKVPLIHHSSFRGTDN